MRNKRSVILSWLIGATIIAFSAIVPAPAQERLRIGSGHQVCCSTKQGGKEILSISAARLPFRVELWDRSDQHI